MSRHVLLVEDDTELGAQLLDRLTRAGYSPVWWKHGRSIGAGELAEVELVILDLMLPGVTGLDMLKSLREHSDVPVLVLSARQDTGDKVRALQLGADDYMTKPFWPEELLERVRARLRRPVLSRGPVTKIGALSIDRDKVEATLADRPLDLTPAEFAFLALLAERPGEPVTRRALAERVLDPETDAQERGLDVHASRLRKKLGAGWVETVWGVGYRVREP